MKTSFLFLADGFEEIEALATVDILRRAGIEVKTVSIYPHKHATGAHGVEVTADLTFKEADFGGSDWLILPGGMPGASNLYAFEPLTDLLKIHHGRIAAICAAPAVVLAPLGLLRNIEATCYPGFEGACKEGDAIMKNQRVVTTERIITANGPSSAIPFALAIVEATRGTAVANEVAGGMLV